MLRSGSGDSRKRKEINMEEKLNLIKKECLQATTTDVIELITGIMQKEYISIHGPEHHILDGSCLLTVLHNAGMDFDLESALDEMRERGKKMPAQPAVSGVSVVRRRPLVQRYPLFMKQGR